MSRRVAPAVAAGHAADRIWPGLGLLLAVLLGFAMLLPAAPTAAQEGDDQVIDLSGGTPEAETADEESGETTSQAAEDEDATATATAVKKSGSTSDSDGTTTSRKRTKSNELIVVEKVNLRAKPDPESKVVAVIPAKAHLTARAQTAENDYLPVTYKDKQGWAYVPFVVTADLGDNLATVTTELNLRTGPSVAEEILLVMPEGAQVRVAGYEVDADGAAWNRVYYEDTFAWALGEYIIFNHDLRAGAGTADSSSSEPAAAPAEIAAGSELVTTTQLNLRDQPSLNGGILSVLAPDTALVADGAVEEGYAPVTVDSVSGWVAVEFLTVATGTGPDPEQATDAPASETGEKIRVILEDVALRTGPSPDADLIMVIPAGEIVAITPDGAADGYVTIYYQGTVGWALAEYLGE